MINDFYHDKKNRNSRHTYFSSASSFSKSTFSNNNLINVLKFEVFLLFTTNESQMLFSRSVNILSSWLKTEIVKFEKHVINMTYSLSAQPIPNNDIIIIYGSTCYLT